jgi:hypothetical protein
MATISLARTPGELASISPQICVMSRSRSIFAVIATYRRVGVQQLLVKRQVEPLCTPPVTVATR